jgi:hypothetical protein
MLAVATATSSTNARLTWAGAAAFARRLGLDSLYLVTGAADGHPDLHRGGHRLVARHRPGHHADRPAHRAADRRAVARDGGRRAPPGAARARRPARGPLPVVDAGLGVEASAVGLRRPDDVEGPGLAPAAAARRDRRLRDRGHHLEHDGGPAAHARLVVDRPRRLGRRPRAVLDRRLAGGVRRHGDRPAVRAADDRPGARQRGGDGRAGAGRPGPGHARARGARRDAHRHARGRCASWRAGCARRSSPSAGWARL